MKFNKGDWVVVNKGSYLAGTYGIVEQYIPKGESEYFHNCDSYKIITKDRQFGFEMADYTLNPVEVNDENRAIFESIINGDTFTEAISQLNTKYNEGDRVMINERSKFAGQEAIIVECGHYLDDENEYLVQLTESGKTTFQVESALDPA